MAAVSILPVGSAASTPTSPAANSRAKLIKGVPGLDAGRLARSAIMPTIIRTPQPGDLIWGGGGPPADLSADMAFMPKVTSARSRAWGPMRRWP